MRRDESRPLDAVYAVVWLDALVLEVRDQGVVQNKAAYLAIGQTLEGHKGRSPRNIAAMDHRSVHVLAAPRQGANPSLR